MWIVRALPILLVTPLALACGRASPPVTTPPLEVSTTGMHLRASLADASFMQGMILHHAQAMYMARLVPPRTRAMDVRALAERIEVSQRDEIALMTRWLSARFQPVPDTSHAVAGHDLPEHRMPGMLTAEDLRQLGEARGDAFDRLFLSLMIRHHEGALAMVQQRASRPGPHDPEASRFAADVDADQRAEIARMRRMLASRGSPDGAP